jgi:tetratricopeptide (TPR) repeat protein
MRFHIDLLSYFRGSVSLFCSLLLNVFLITEVSLFPNRVTVGIPFAATQQQPQSFITALLDFASGLLQQGKASTVLEIRDAMSHLLHLLGAHEARLKLGGIALEAAVQAKDEVRHAQILIDDLGWAGFALGQRKAADGNIRRGISIAESIPASDKRAFGRAHLIAAKGYRHLAMMLGDDVSADQMLKSAWHSLELMEAEPFVADLFQKDLVRDFAQVEHARASLIMRSVGIEQSGILSAANGAGIKKAQDALELLNRAEEAFSSVNDFERLTKILKSKERLLSAMGDDTAAVETRAQRESVARTNSIRKE